MKLFFILVLFIFCKHNVNAQISLPKNAIFLEAGGNGLFGSLNYSRQLTKLPGLGLHVGYGFYTEFGYYSTIPIGFTYLFNTKMKNSFIEGGLGSTFAIRNTSRIIYDGPKIKEDFASFVPSISYKKYAKHNLIWSAKICAVANKYTLMPWLGVTIGKTF